MHIDRLAPLFLSSAECGRLEARPLIIDVRVVYACLYRRNVQTRKLADHMALLTDHVFFMPDLYRDDPWVPGMAEKEEERWRRRVGGGRRRDDEFPHGRYWSS